MLDSLIDRIMYVIDKPLTRDKYELISGITLRQDAPPTYRLAKNTNRSLESAFDKVEEFARTHRIDIDLHKLLPISRSISSGKCASYLFKLNDGGHIFKQATSLEVYPRSNTVAVSGVSTPLMRALFFLCFDDCRKSASELRGSHSLFLIPLLDLRRQVQGHTFIEIK